MTTNYAKNLISLAEEIQVIARDLPKKQRHKIYNRCEKMKLITRKSNRQMADNTITIPSTPERYIAKKAIFEALMAGRHLSQLDCKEFMVEDMRTPISHMKEDYIKTHDLKTAWIVSPVRKARLKEYWLERRA